MKLKHLAVLCGLIMISAAAGVIENAVRSPAKTAYPIDAIKSVSIHYTFLGMGPAEDNTYEIKCAAKECVAAGQESTRRMGRSEWEQRSIPAKFISCSLVESMAKALVNFELANGPRTYADICRENMCVTHASWNLPFCEAFQCISYTDSFPEYKITITTTTDQNISIYSTGTVWNFNLERHWYTQITGEFSQAYYQLMRAISPGP